MAMVGVGDSHRTLPGLYPRRRTASRNVNDCSNGMRPCTVNCADPCASNFGVATSPARPPYQGLRAQQYRPVMLEIENLAILLAVEW